MAGDPLNRSPYSDGFRTPTPARNPRWPFEGETQPDPHMTSTEQHLRTGDHAAPKKVPRLFRFFRTPDLKAPYVGLPDQRRTSGHLLHSGTAWGRDPKDGHRPLAPPIQKPA